MIRFASVTAFTALLAAFHTQVDTDRPATVAPQEPGVVAHAVESPRAAPRIALQAGHWRADEAPWELRGLRDNGTSWRGTAEWEVNLDIARRAGAGLEALGYVVDILPAVVPPDYRADLFIAIHADGSNDPNASGFRVASPRRDATGRASEVAALLADAYGEATGLRWLQSSTRRMRNYYAFNYRRYEHSLHRSTVGVIIETGFLTSSRDRNVIIDDPERAARGIVQAVVSFPETSPPSSTGGLDSSLLAESNSRGTLPGTAAIPLQLR